MNRYEIIRELGKGSYGSVKLARDKSTKELYAIKKVKLCCLSKAEREKSLGEVKVLSSIKHPNVVAYKESFQENQTLYIVMEYIDGGDLDKVITNQRNKLMDEADILRYFVQIVSVVAYLHAHNILHRDLKPQNVFLTKLGIVKLGDFGVAKSLESSCDLAKTVIGTPFYLSPEIWEGSPYDSKSDIWSLGCILFELCALHKPFEAQNASALLASVIQGKHGPIPSRYSQNMRDLIEGMLNLAPQLRPTAQQVMDLPFIQKAANELISRNQKTLQTTTPQRTKSKRVNPKPRTKGKFTNNRQINHQNDLEEFQDDFNDDFNDDFQMKYSNKINTNNHNHNNNSNNNSNDNNNNKSHGNVNKNNIYNNMNNNDFDSSKNSGRDAKNPRPRILFTAQNQNPLKFSPPPQSKIPKTSQNNSRIPAAKSAREAPKWALSNTASKRVQPTFGGAPAFNEDFISDDEDLSPDQDLDIEDDFIEDDFIDDNDSDDDGIQNSSKDEFHVLEETTNSLRDSLRLSADAPLWTYKPSPPSKNTEPIDFGLGQVDPDQIETIRSTLEDEIGDAQFALLYAHVLTENIPSSAKFIKDYEKKNRSVVGLVRDLIKLEQRV
ncbi:Serine/threonine-protein kinase Nek3 [Tritrichomonas foetus]|uniref:non-specific serine/threonine protein kinase n=1 Tax=Tritrichomonas foetus TaxID=1144522 RepID=A0A1J4KGJ2_9EUKA|nr:Serine/threonine-protein kinase Nek3 [Tritrichomonas foetus]|eukprot:OHT10519.1 Serine/threonine-protein kinase Nek3 [Tritrichomonas foetus]